MIKEFLKEAEDFIYKEVAKNANLLLGKNKTASLSTGMFLKLPVRVEVEQVTSPIPKLYKELETFMPYFSAYTKVGNTTEVFFTFMYYEEKDLKQILNHMHRYSLFFAFVYMHEVQHILRKHVTTSYSTMMQRIAGDTPNSHELINIAEDHAINYSLKDIFVAAHKAHSSVGKSYKLMDTWNEIEKICLYNKSYHEDQLSDIDILKDLLSKSKTPNTIDVSDLFQSVSFGGKESIQPKEGSTLSQKDVSNNKEGKCSTVTDDMDISISDLAESLKDIITENTRGTETGNLFEQLFESIKVDTGWFKKVKASFKRQVFYKTHDYTTSWRNLNSTYRHIYMAPKKTFIDDKISIILSVDHSGSMSTEDLQRLLYLIESESKRISELKVLVHDTQIIKEFTISNEYDISKSPEFSSALATRYTSGGTSHECIFDYIQNMGIKDTSQVMYMSFSDNQSDIEQTFKKYPIMRKITNYWVCTERNPVAVPGTNITMV